MHFRKFRKMLTKHIGVVDVEYHQNPPMDKWKGPLKLERSKGHNSLSSWYNWQIQSISSTVQRMFHESIVNRYQDTCIPEVSK